jgi:hypothetical protein
VNATSNPDTTPAPRRAPIVKSIGVHLEGLLSDLPRGRAGAPVRGRQVADDIVRALRQAHLRRLRLCIEGKPVEIMEDLKERGLADLLPNRVAAAAALRLLAERTPLVVQTGRGRFRVSLTAR